MTKIAKQQRAAKRQSGPPLFELQYHPGDIRKSVRYVFLSRKHVTWAVLGLAGWLLLLVVAAAVTPAAVADALAARRYHGLVEERTALGDRLEELVRVFGTLEQMSEATRTEMAKIYLAYGFDNDDAVGQGGYPTPPETVPASIYASTIKVGNDLRARVDEQLKVLDAFMREVEGFEEAHREQVRTTPSISPLRGEFVLTSPFGNRRSPFTKEIDFHNGIDLAAAIGTPIHAPADGVVTFAGRVAARQNISFWRYGNLVAINHGDRFVTLFAHCDELLVKAKQTVKQGDVIATVGNTGWSTSPHLHYEVRRRPTPDATVEIPRDPRIYILDHRWRDEEQILIRARSAPDLREYEPLPSIMRR